MITGMDKSGKILENYEADLENTAFHYIGSYSMRLLPCFHYISPTFCGQNFGIVSISAKPRRYGPISTASTT